MKILVTGGMGFVGNALAHALLKRGHEVHALGRSVNPAKEKLLPGLIYHSHDLSKKPLSKHWFKKTEVVFHVAAKAGVGGKYLDYKLANLVATEKLLQTCKEYEVCKFIHTSTPSVVFSPNPIRGGDESLTYSKEDFSPYASTKSLAEQAVLAADDPAGMRTLALRPHLVWGPGDPHLLPRVVARHRAGRLRIIGDGKNQVDLTHIENVVHAHLCALDAMISNPDLGATPYFIGQNEPVRLWDWLNQVFAELHLAPLNKFISYKTAYNIGWLMEQSWKILPLKDEPPMTRFVACQLAHDHWFSEVAAKRDLGYQPLLSMEEALRKTLPWLRNL